MSGKKTKPSSPRRTKKDLEKTTPGKDLVFFVKQLFLRPHLGFERIADKNYLYFSWIIPVLTGLIYGCLTYFLLEPRLQVIALFSKDLRSNARSYLPLIFLGIVVLLWLSFSLFSLLFARLLGSYPRFTHLFSNAAFSFMPHLVIAVPLLIFWGDTEVLNPIILFFQPVISLYFFYLLYLALVKTTGLKVGEAVSIWLLSLFTVLFTSESVLFIAILKLASYLQSAFPGLTGTGKP